MEIISSLSENFKGSITEGNMWGIYIYKYKALEVQCSVALGFLLRYYSYGIHYYSYLQHCTD